jgi:hypothetical protein
VIAQAEVTTQEQQGFRHDEYRRGIPRTLLLRTTPKELARMSDLIDTTEMYLRTIFELEEDNIVPMRARIAERLGQSGPTVSQTAGGCGRGSTARIDRCGSGEGYPGHAQTSAG